MIVSGKKTGKKSFVSNFVAGFSEKYKINASKSAKLRQKLSQRLKNRYKTARLNLKTGFSSSKKSVFSFVNTSKIIRPLSIAIISFFVGLSAGLVFNPVVTTNALAEQGIEPKPSEEPSALSSKSLPEKTSLPEISTDYTYSTSASQANLAKTSEKSTSSLILEIPSINLKTSFIFTYVNDKNEIVVPGSTVGSLTSYHSRVFRNKSVLVGHRTDIFAGLGGVNYGDPIIYLGKKYTVTSRYQKVLTSSDMRTIIADSTGPDTIILITCAGPNYSERLVITAEAI